MGSASLLLDAFSLGLFPPFIEFPSRKAEARLYRLQTKVMISQNFNFEIKSEIQ